MLTSDGAYGASSTLSSSRLQDHLELAGRLVDRHLQVDGRFPQLVDQLKITQQGVPEVSGLHDYDYPNLAAIGPGLETLPEISPVKKIPLPAELVEQFAHMQCNCTMGLFPEIGRAWLTIDSSIFVWTYEDGGDLAYFDGLGETIFGVGLLKPKRGIFQRHIHYLLCLTTPMEIVLLGVSFSKSFDDPTSDIVKSEMHLLPEPLFSLSSDNTYMLTIMGMENGRIFLGGKDCCLYELVYQAEEGWFSHRCRKINHSTSSLSFLVPSFLYFGFAEEDSIVQIVIDNTRNILYTRTEKGTITVYDLGVDGTGTTKIASINQSSIVQNAVNIARTIDQSNFHPIVHISAIEATESSHIYLVAITQTGVRLYFTTVNLSNPLNRPSMVQLLHVRLPTGFSAVSPPMRPSKVHMAYHKRGLLLMASAQTEDSDMLWCLGNDSFSFQHQLMETQTTIQTDGKTWAMAEMPHAMHVVVAPYLQPPLIVTQHRDHPRKFVLLSAQGSQIITKLRPVDQLRHLLFEYNGPDCEPIRAFFALHQDDQACEMCLILACSPSMQDKQIADWATRAFFLYGGDPQVRLPPTYQDWNSTLPGHFSTFSSPISGFQPAQASTPNPSSYQTGPQASLQQSLYPQLSSTMGFPVGSPARPQASTMDAQAVIPGPDIQYSGKHNGLYLYMSRIVRPLWEERLVAEVPCHTPKGTNLYLGSTFTSEELSYYIEQLKGLKDFLKSHNNAMLPLVNENLNAAKHLPQRLGSILGSGDQTIPSQQQQIQARLNAEAQLQEKASIYNLQQLTDRTIEILGLWRILYDHQFHIITSSLSKDYQNQLRSMTFKDLIITGQQLASVMIANLINRYLGDNATTDAVSARLREVCPTIYKEEDATFSKANELLRQSQKASNKYEKDTLIKEAIQLCQHVVPRVNMPIICQQLQAVHCYDGIIDLCLLAAARRDPQNLALYYYRNGEKPEDHHGHEAFRSRMEAYKFITDALTHLMVSGLGHPHSTSIPRSPGPPSPPNVLDPELASNWFDKCLKLCLKSEDEMFHIALYNWLLDQRLEDKLLEIKSPYVESYLVFATSQYTDNVALIDLLWKYYERSDKYGSAAKILAKLADRHGTDIPMCKRLEYLSRAIVCMKSAEVLPGSRVEGEFLHELQEKMEVARIQSQILDALMQLNIRGTQDAISRLNSDLLDLTQLYEEFAFPFHLHECQLAILHCASLHDPALVETLWQNIIDKELSNQSGNSPETRVMSLENKLKSLGKMYALSQKYFPLPFLIKYLETKSVILKLNPKWVFSMLQAIGIPLPKILEMYNKFYKSKDQQWLPINRSLHLLKVLSQIVTTFADCPSLVPSNERRQFITICLDGISSYLVDLQALDGTNPNVCIIIDSLRSTQIRLERLL